MTKVSKRFLNKDLENRIFDLFVQTVVELRDSEDVKNFIEDLLSPTERIMLVKRLAIALLLAKGYTYDEIDNTLKVSRQTIMHVSLKLRHGKSGYEKVVAKLVREQKREALVDNIEEILLRLSLPKAEGSIGFEKKQKRGKELFKRNKLRNLL